MKRAASPRPVVRVVVNGHPQELEVGGEVQPWHTLLHTLREVLGLRGTKIGCNQGGCGFCTVLMDGRPVLACSLLTVECEGASITTIEGLRSSSIMTTEGLQEATTEKLHPLQQSFIDNFAFECGMCTPGMIMSAKALLDKKPDPTEEDVKEALSGNLCRCGTYPNMIKAVREAAKAQGND